MKAYGLHYGGSVSATLLPTISTRLSYANTLFNGSSTKFDIIENLVDNLINVYSEGQDNETSLYPHIGEGNVLCWCELAAACADVCYQWLLSRLIINVFKHIHIGTFSLFRHILEPTVDLVLSYNQNINVKLSGR